MRELSGIILKRWIREWGEDFSNVKRRKFLKDWLVIFMNLLLKRFHVLKRCIFTWLEFLLSCLTFPRSNRHFHRSTLDAFERGALQSKHRVITRSIIPHDFLLSFFLQGKKIATSLRHVYTKYVILGKIVWLNLHYIIFCLIKSKEGERRRNNG